MDRGGNLQSARKLASLLSFARVLVLAPSPRGQTRRACCPRATAARFGARTTIVTPRIPPSRPECW